VNEKYIGVLNEVFLLKIKLQTKKQKECIERGFFARINPFHE